MYRLIAVWFLMSKRLLIKKFEGKQNILTCGSSAVYNTQTGCSVVGDNRYCCFCTITCILILDIM